jgi:hypothetical protein
MQIPSRFPLDTTLCCKTAQLAAMQGVASALPLNVVISGSFTIVQLMALAPPRYTGEDAPKLPSDMQ